MIGQYGNKEIIGKWQLDNSFPRFLIITGEKGAGKSTLAHYIANKGICGYTITCENSVEAVREAVANSYKCSTPTTYIFTNTDKMSPQAKNALLKVTEEPPKKAHFIMTVEDINNTLGTLKSRGTELQVEIYTYADLSNFTQDENILAIATNPGQVKQLLGMDVKEFIGYCNKILDNVGSVTGVNALKIGNSFKFKEDQEGGYDPILFFNTLMYICSQRVFNSEESSELIKLMHSIICCSKHKNEMRMTGVKKDATFDMFILEFRDIWREV